MFRSARPARSAAAIWGICMHPTAAPATHAVINVLTTAA
jgi:hypothetical protein